MNVLLVEQQVKDAHRKGRKPCRNSGSLCRNQSFLRSCKGVMPVLCLMKWLKWD
jgi:hypothetical protein